MSDVRITEPDKPTVELLGGDGNAFAIMGKVKRALKDAGYHPDQVQAYLDEAMAGDYNDLLAVTMKWVEVT